MKSFHMIMAVNSAAFGETDTDRDMEVARILRRIADKLENGDSCIESYQTVFDANGNDVGRYAIKTQDYLKTAGSKYLG